MPNLTKPIALFILGHAGTGKSFLTRHFVLQEQKHGRAWCVLDKDVVSECWSRSEEHTSELQSLMRISYAVFCLKKKKSSNEHNTYSKHYITDYKQRYTHNSEKH